MMYVNYQRISTSEERGLQKYNRQEKALKKWAEQNHVQFFGEFKEDKSGKNFEDRTEFNRMVRELEKVKESTIVFKDITRFSREAENGYNKYMELFNKRINLIFIDNPTLSTDYIKNLLNIAENQNIVTKTALESIVKLLLIVELDRSETERLTLTNRIRDGIKASDKNQGRKKGQLDKITPELVQAIKNYRTDRSISIQSIMDKFKLSRNTVKKYISLSDEKLCQIILEKEKEKKK